ncbi:MAG: PKD domain-containing protein [Crocinitomicaceae bacterium]|nr:PKD domain-containing protein [Crocinitomicaceae bacterium]
MRIIATVFLCFFSAVSIAQDSASVLFIGNSYTYVNNMPALLSDLATSLGDVVYQNSQVQGGAQFSTHAGNPATFTSISAEPWDFVVLQAQSQEPSFPDNQVDMNTVPFAKQLADSVYANNFCSEVLMFMTWGRENGDPQWGPISTFDGMNERLRNAYLRMADTVQGSVSPVGVAWKYIRDNHPTIGLYTADGSHPSLEGSYLAACTFYASIFRKSPSGATFISSLDPATASILQDAASMTVLDSLEVWNLRPMSEHTQAEFSFSESMNQVDFTNLSTKATTYAWDFGDGLNSVDENPIHTYMADGIYTVTLIASSPCDEDTVTYQVITGEASLSSELEPFVLKRIGESMYVFEGLASSTKALLYSINGQLIKTMTSDTSISIDLTNQASGVYVVKLQIGSKTYTKRLMK